MAPHGGHKTFKKWEALFLLSVAGLQDSQLASYLLMTHV